MRVVRDGRTVKASVEVDPGTTRVELRIHSDRNRKIPKLSDPSPRDPGYEKARERRFHRDVLYPVVDVALQPGMDGVLELERVVVGQWLINPHYYRQDRTPLARVNVIPGGRLEHWENWFCFNDCHLEAGAFYLKCVLAAEAGEATASLELLSDAWAGRLEVWTASGDDPVLIDSADVTWPAEPRRVTTAGDLGPASLETALIGCRCIRVVPTVASRAAEQQSVRQRRAAIVGQRCQLRIDHRRRRRTDNVSINAVTESGGGADIADQVITCGVERLTADVRSGPARVVSDDRVGHRNRIERGVMEDPATESIGCQIAIGISSHRRVLHDGAVRHGQPFIIKKTTAGATRDIAGQSRVDDCHDPLVVNTTTLAFSRVI